MVFKLVALLVPIALCQSANAFQIRKIGTDAGTVLKLRGDVRDGDYGRLKSILQDGSVVGLQIRSGGGTLEDGFEIARLVWEKGLVVYASKQCDSVCAFIFFAAKERYMSRGSKIGVHSVSNERGKEDASTVRTTVMMSRFLVELGVPHSIIGKIVATPPARIAFLSNPELMKLKVRQSNPFRSPDRAEIGTRSKGPSSVCRGSLDNETEAAAHAEQHAQAGSAR